MYQVGDILRKTRPLRSRLQEEAMVDASGETAGGSKTSRMVEETHIHRGRGHTKLVPPYGNDVKTNRVREGPTRFEFHPARQRDSHPTYPAALRKWEAQMSIPSKMEQANNPNYTRKFRLVNGILRLDWTAHSPDMNPNRDCLGYVVEDAHKGDNGAPIDVPIGWHSGCGKGCREKGYTNG